MRPRRLPDIYQAANAAVSLLLKLPPKLEVRRDVEFGGGGSRPLRMHIVRPAGSKPQPYPVVVYIFGGGWQGGSPDQGLLPLALLARRGFVCISVDYRLSYEASFPAQLHDCKCAIRFLRANARELGIDASRIGVAGPSAGGHLAALLGVTAGIESLEGSGGWPDESSEVQAVVDWFGPTDLLALGYEQQNVNSPTSMTARLIGGPLLQNRQRAAAANPVSYTQPGRLYPPFLIMHGALDTLVSPSQSELLHQALIRAGGRSELEIVPGKGHEQLGLNAALRSARFLDRELKKHSSEPRHHQR